MSGARRAKTPKGQDRRQQIVDAAAEMLRVGGPGVVSHRSVARQVGCSLSAMTYYFSGLEDLLEEAGRINIARWARRAEGVAESLELGERVSDRAAIVDHILAATLPVDEILLGHYQQLVAAGASDPVSRAYRTGRDRLNAALSRVLDSCQGDCDDAAGDDARQARGDEVRRPPLTRRRNPGRGTDPGQPRPRAVARPATSSSPSTVVADDTDPSFVAARKVAASERTCFA
jgi:DNA-binding transcriptional regulator YbjK